MFLKVAFTMYPVRDGARARKFYEETLGFTRGSDSGEDATWTEYDMPGGGCLALWQTDRMEPSADAGGSIAFEVSDLDALLERLRAEGVAFDGDIIQSPVCRMAVILDPDGNSLILHQLHPAHAT